MEDYRLEDLSILRDHYQLNRGTVYLDQLAYSILKGINVLYGSSSGMKMVLKIVDPLFAVFRDGPAPLPPLHVTAESKPLPGSSPTAILRQHYRNLVCQEALGLVNRILTHPGLEPHLQSFITQTSPTNSTRWREFFQGSELQTLTRYLRMLMGSPLAARDVSSGIKNLAPILCGVSRDRISQMGIEAEMEEFRTAWVALQDSWRFSIVPEPEPDAPNPAQDERTS